MNDENLKKGKATQFTSGEDAAKNGKKGGEASAKARRKKADIRKAAQAILDGEYKADEGKTMNGAEAIVLNMFQKAVSVDDKQSVQAARLLLELTGQDKTPEDRKRIKQALKLQEKEIELMQKRIDNADW